MISATMNATASVMPNVAPTGPAKVVPIDNLMESLHNTGHFKHLIAAIKATGLTSLFHTAGPHTLFAPNDYAFGKLSRDLLMDLFRPEEKGRLTALLRLHLVPRRVKAAVSGDKPAPLKSLQGGDLTMHTAQGLRVNEARIVERDIEASNGLIHVIDTVLMPTAG